MGWQRRCRSAVYFDWSFITGEEVDFESLVEIIEPRVIDEKVGIRSMDCQTPGFVRVDDQGVLVPGGENGMSAPAPDIQGLEGALRSPYTKSNPENFTPNAFQDELTTLLNLPDTVAADFSAPVADSSDDADFLLDPVVSLSFYGQNHARKHKTDKLPFDAANTGWVHDLNRDPRTRVPAAFGTTVIQKNQEKLMQRAWQQVQTIFEGNRLVRGAQFIAKVSARITVSFFDALPETKLLAVTAALHAKVLGSPTTLRKQMRESRLRAPVLSATFRRLTRPGGRIARRLTAAGKPLDHAALIYAVNTGIADPAPAARVAAEPAVHRRHRGRGFAGHAARVAEMAHRSSARGIARRARDPAAGGARDGRCRGVDRLRSAWPPRRSAHSGGQANGARAQVLRRRSRIPRPQSPR